ncbi:hypothetical protein [Hymenobacter crusticola]|uniref:Uncharacterized protein n=1 Tax=Hymenobacter crusticola TaxID=1770526 RepID=A0A243WEJ8_9BACT|nr:hypothetical protein [Hymenobacter crusticola]OUJ74133.1 hypothetical protein BXP70_10355 [Hymenobacter crusticola]
MAACTGRSTVSEKRVSTVEPPPAEHAPFDVTALVGRNIDQLRRKLGPPREAAKQNLGLEPTPAQKQTAAGENWNNTFEKDGTTLIVSFNARTRKVHDIIVVGDDEEELMRRGKLTLTALNYIVLPVLNPENTSRVLGLRVVPLR